MRRLAPLAVMALVVAGCLGGGPFDRSTPRPSTPRPVATPAVGQDLRYVALGETYTIGEGLPRQPDRWPNQLVRALRQEVPMAIAANLAVQSSTTGEVIDEQLPVLEELEPDVVSLLIGVNDVIRGFTDEEYRANLEVILDGRSDDGSGPPVTGILDLVPPDRVFLVTTPDYTLTPRGPAFQRPDDADTIDRFNAILEDVGRARGVAVVDISPISDLVPRDPTLIADDGLHPSAKQFAGWVELIAPVVRDLLIAD